MIGLTIIHYKKKGEYEIKSTIKICFYTDSKKCINIKYSDYHLYKKIVTISLNCTLF